MLMWIGFCKMQIWMTEYAIRKRIAWTHFYQR